MKKALKHIFTLCITVITTSGLTQDIHFSQYQSSVINLNPALAGTADGYLRAAANYKSQWSAFGNPFKTMGLSIDAPVFKGSKRKGAFLGTGINIFQDKAGSSNLSKLHIAGDVSGVIITGNGYFSVGFEAAYGQRSISDGGLKWDNQFSGTTFNASAPTGESAGGSRAFIDMSAGAAYIIRRGPSTLSSNDKLDLTFSAAVYHLNKPNTGLSGSDPMNMKYVGSVLSIFGISNTNLQLMPKFLYLQQGSLREINLGCVFNYILKDGSKVTGFNTEMGLGVGASYRFGDAVIPELHYYYGGYYIGVSYDVNISSLTPYSLSRGGFEVCLRYTDIEGALWGKNTSGRKML